MVRKMECYIMLLSRLASVESPPRCSLSSFPLPGHRLLLEVLISGFLSL